MARTTHWAPLLAAILGASLTGQTVLQTCVLATATASLSPPALTLAWPSDATATGYQVSRRESGITGASGYDWTVTVPGGGTATSWADTTVVPGIAYDYRITKSGTPTGRGLLTAAIELPPVADRGKLVLLVDATLASGLALPLERLVQDLVGDGWSVLRHDVSRTDSVGNIKAQILSDAAAYPNQLRAVFLLGHVPVPYSGNISVDGHPDHQGAWPADLYYGDLDGVWSDTGVNATVASRVANHNVPGDGKFDQSSIPSDVDLAVGRVDCADMPAFAAGELALLQQYLDRDHAWRQAALPIARRGVVDDNFGYFYGEAFAATGWRSFVPLVGQANVFAGDYFTTLATSAGGCLWSYGCGGGTYTSAGGVGSTANFAASSLSGVFTVLFGSYFGDWDVTNNFLRAPLCSGAALTNVWGGRPHWSFHHMGIGEPIGTSARHTQNGTALGVVGSRTVHVALMGDPTLRQDMIVPPSAVTVADQWPTVTVSWTASSDAVFGYHVFRSTSALGPFVQLTPSAVPGTAFVDVAPVAGDLTYMVRALRLEVNGSGSYWNLSQGAFATQSLPTQAAAHSSYGLGCYAVSDSFYQAFATPAAASLALSGRAITLTPSAGGYQVGAGGSYVPFTAAATVLVLGDEGEATVSLSQPLTYPGGTTNSLTMHANGIVAASPLGLPSFTAPSAAGLLNQTAAAWYCWHDFAPHEPGSGAVLAQEIAGTMYVTWFGVESYPAGPNPSTLQFQFELATGVVRYVWASITTIGTGQATTPSEQFVVGWSPAGPSVDRGATDLTALPFAVAGFNLQPLALSASPTPVVTPTTGVVVQYQIADAPAFSPGLHVGFVIASLLPSPGLPLDAMGMPGCTQYLGSLDLFLFTAGPTAALNANLPIAAGAPRGITLHAQAVALVPPGSLPNGQNALGAVVSNRISSFVNDR